MNQHITFRVRTVIVTCITLVVILIFISVNSLEVSAFTGTGTGTETDPYIITTVEQLDAVRDDLDACYELGNDLDVSAYLEENYPGVGWEPIGSYDEHFTGVFDGNEHKIIGMHIDRAGYYIGMFGIVGAYSNEDISIRNLNLEIDITAEDSFNVGGLIGYNLNGIISNCNINGTIDSASIGRHIYAGGLIGLSYNGIITKSSSKGIVNGASPDRGLYVGGLIGFDGNGTITDCISNSVVTGVAASTNEGDWVNAGGLVGENFGGSAIGCESSGTVSGSSVDGIIAVGGLVGRNSGGNGVHGTIKNSYSNNTVTGSSSNNDVCLGGLVGLNGGGDGEWATIINSVSDGAVTCFSSPKVFAGGLVGSNFFGDVSSSSSDCSVTVTDSSYIYIGGLLGNSRGPVSNCYSSGTVMATASSDGVVIIGGLVGKNSGGITTCYSRSPVSGTAYEVSEGGAVGANDGTVSDSYYDIETSGCIDTGKGEPKTTAEMMQEATFSGWDFENIWGIEENTSYPFLLLQEDQTITITQEAPVQATYGDTFEVTALATSSLPVLITATDGCSVISGGEGSAVIGMDSGTKNGFIQFNQGGNSNFNSASEVAIEIVAQRADATINVQGTTVAYDGEAHGATGAATGVDGEDLSFDLDLGEEFSDVPGGTAVWTFLDSSGNYTHNSGTVEIVIFNEFTGVGSGTEADPYIIVSAKELDEVRYELDAFYVLGDDIDLFDYLEANQPDMGWEPIGSTNEAFSGVFEGNGYKITSLFIDRVGHNIGMFGLVDKGTLQNIELEVDIRAKVSDCVGGLVGSFKEGEVTNCNINGIVSGSSTDGPLYLGGLIGYKIDGSITNCYSKCTVTGATASYYRVSIGIGGLVGYNTSIITNCYSSGLVTGTTTSFASVYVGGLAGSSYGTIQNCYSNSVVSGSSLGDMIVGGLVGSGSNISNSYYDSETSGCNDIGCGEPKTRVEMMQEATFVDWDFENVWGIIENVSYPFLLSLQTLSDQTIIVIQEPPVQAAYGATFEVSATAGSGLPVTITADGGCSITSGGEGSAIIHMDSGTTDGSIQFNQSGDTNYNPAPEIVWTVTAQKADATINVQGISVTYDGNAHGATGTAIGVDEEDLSTSLDLGATFVDIPGGTASWSFSHPNYNGQSGSVAITIKASSDSGGGSSDGGSSYTIPVVVVPLALPDYVVVAEGDQNIAVITSTEEGNIISAVMMLSEMQDIDAVRVESSVATITLPKALFEEIGNVRLEITNVAAFTDAQKVSVGDASVFDFRWISLEDELQMVSTFSMPMSIRMPYVLKAEEDPRYLTVFYLADDGSIENMCGIYEDGWVEFMTNHFSSYYISYNPVDFKDTNNEKVLELASKGIINGKGDSLYDPQGFLTRAELATLLVRALNLETQDSGDEGFKDVSVDAWYYKYIMIAKAEGLIKGIGGGIYSPDTSVRSQDAMIMISRIMQTYKGVEGNQVVGSLTGISDYAADHVSLLMNLGFVEKDFIEGIEPINRESMAEIVHAMYFYQ